MVIKPPVRGQDKHGSGEYGAPRGKRKHKGIDMACYAGSIVVSSHFGVVTKIGFPYDQSHSARPDAMTSKEWSKYKKKKALRYVQITNSTGVDFRYFYVNPMVKIGQTVKTGEELGVVQNLIDIYPGITEHFHFEVKEDGLFLNPHEYI